jgi:hypothetical protein
MSSAGQRIPHPQFLRNLGVQQGCYIKYIHMELWYEYMTSPEESSTRKTKRHSLVNKFAFYRPNFNTVFTVARPWSLLLYKIATLNSVEYNSLRHYFHACVVSCRNDALWSWVSYDRSTASSKSEFSIECNLVFPLSISRKFPIIKIIQ